MIVTQMLSLHNGNTFEHSVSSLVKNAIHVVIVCLENTCLLIYVKKRSTAAMMVVSKLLVVIVIFCRSYFSFILTPDRSALVAFC